MSRRILKDVEEALSREVRRISFHENRTVDEVVLQEMFDPFTGELLPTNIEPDFYDSSADTSHRQYPHFFVRLMKTREDLYTNRVESQWGNQIVCANEKMQAKPISAPKAYEVIISMKMGEISSPGNIFELNIFKIRKVQVGYLLRVLDGNNKGTYKITIITIDPSGNHTLTVSNDLLENLPSFHFNSTDRIVTFFESTDLNTIKIGDVFEDAASTTFNITAIDLDNVTITIDGVATPDTSTGGKISRTGNVFQTSDPDPVCFVILDPDQPVLRSGIQIAAGNTNYNAPIPLDLYYRIRIDSKERDSHIEVLNRMWEEFNPPRTALPVVIRTKDSAEELLTEAIPSGGSVNFKVASNLEFNINDPVFIFNDFTPTKSTTGGFQEPFKAVIVDKIGTDTIVLDTTVPDTFLITDCTKIVSNAKFKLLFFHFVDHNTRDVEGAQYWVHEFDFWVQVDIDRQGESIEFDSNINGISTPIENFDGITLIPDL